MDGDWYLRYQNVEITDWVTHFEEFESEENRIREEVKKGNARNNTCSKRVTLKVDKTTKANEEEKQNPTKRKRYGRRRGRRRP